MANVLSANDLNLLLREAERGASHLVFNLRLPPHERDDLRQDLLVDLIKRLKHFDPARGSLGAFATTVISHRAALLVARVRRDRHWFQQLSLDEPSACTPGTTLGDTVAEEGGYLAVMGQPVDRFAAVERRLDMEWAIGALCRRDQELCSHLVRRAPTELCRKGFGSRAGLYRQIHEIRLALMAHGLSAAT